MNFYGRDCKGCFMLKPLVALFLLYSSSSLACDGIDYGFSPYQAKKEITFSADRHSKNLKIINLFGEIEIIGASQTLVESYFSEDNFGVLYINDENEFFINITAVREDLSDFTREAPPSVRLKLRVPKEIKNIEIISHSAKISLSSLKGLGKVKIRSQSSEVTIKDVEAESFKIKTDSGPVSFLNSSGVAEAKSRRGSILFDAFKGEMSFKLRAGNVSAVDTKGKIVGTFEDALVVVKKNDSPAIDIRGKKGTIDVEGQTGGEITLKMKKHAAGGIVTNNPYAKNQIIFAHKTGYRDLANKWPNVSIKPEKKEESCERKTED